MDLIEALCGALEAAKMDESPEGVAFMDALSSSGSASLEIGEDGSVSLKSGDASLSISAAVIAGEEAGEEPETESMPNG